MNKHLYSTPHPTWISLRFCDQKSGPLHHKAATKSPTERQGWDDGVVLGGWARRVGRRRGDFGSPQFISPFTGHEWNGEEPQTGGLPNHHHGY